VVRAAGCHRGDPGSIHGRVLHSHAEIRAGYRQSCFTPTSAYRSMTPDGVGRRAERFQARPKLCRRARPVATRVVARY
jgi:hypothetical protein